MEEVTNEKESENDADLLELFAALATASDGNRSITDIFKVLPSRKVNDYKQLLFCFMLLRIKQIYFLQ